MGWKGESRRHSLSRKGIKTNQTDKGTSVAHGSIKPDKKAMVCTNWQCDYIHVIPEGDKEKQSKVCPKCESELEKKKVYQCFCGHADPYIRFLQYHRWDEHPELRKHMVDPYGTREK